MLIYADKQSAEYLLTVLRYHQSVSTESVNKEICSTLINQIKEGLKDYV